ncbi:MAG: hypothetical protein ABIU77_24520 [Ferruginibacter sp.]
MEVIKKIMTRIQIKDCVLFFICIVVSYLIVVSYDVLFYHEGVIAYVYYIGSISGVLAYYLPIYFFYLVILKLIAEKEIKKYLRFIILASVLYFGFLYLIFVKYVTASEDAFINQNTFPFWKYFVLVFITVNIVQINVVVVCALRQKGKGTNRHGSVGY